MSQLQEPKIWRASAPSNIALIKYMGKSDSGANLPTNTSLSYTLESLRSLVEIEIGDSSADRWEPLTSSAGETLAPFELSAKGSEKFLKHLARIKNQFGLKQAFIVRSANNFASDCGLASSASSFAALTKAALAASQELSGQPAVSPLEAAMLSRQGSGSSCRSFFSPWAIWRSTTGEAQVSGVPELNQVRMLHQALVVSSEHKAVSSSEAHGRVLTSQLFRGRPERAEERVQQLIHALAAQDWRQAFEITWAEFWDMHALFETSLPSFGYMTAGSLSVLREIRARTWDRGVRGPLVTMDAGANVHLLHIDDPAGQAFAKEVEAEAHSMFTGHRVQVLTSREVARSGVNDR